VNVSDQSRKYNATKKGFSEEKNLYSLLMQVPLFRESVAQIFDDRPMRHVPNNHKSSRRTQTLLVLDMFSIIYRYSCASRVRYLE